MKRFTPGTVFPSFERIPWKSLGLSVALWVLAASGAQAFTHPGLLNNGGDLNRDKAAISAGTEPWRSAWERLQNSWLPGVNGTYTPGPVATLTDANSFQTIRPDGVAAYVNAIEWYMTGNQTYANTAVAILNAWSSTCTSITGGNAQLDAGINFVNMINAAEIIRYSGAGWSASDITKFQNFLVNVVYPPCSPSGYDSWGSCANATMMMIGVFCNNQTIYNQGYSNYTGTNAAVACWTSLFDTSSVSPGQGADSWRDQGHGQLGVSIGLEAAEVALNSSGQNMFTRNNNLLLAAVEYAAKYNLGHGVTWDNTFGTSPTSVSSYSRGSFWPMYALAQAGFTRSGLTGTYTNQVVAAEGIESINIQGGGLGTLLYTQASTSRPSPRYAMQTMPGGFLMAGNNGANAITGESPCIRNLETFQEVIQGNGYSAFKSVANGKYVTVNGTISLLANSTTIGTAQQFKVIDLGDRVQCLVSQLNGKMVTAGANNVMAASMSYSTSFYNKLNVYAVGTTVPGVLTGFNNNTYRLTNVNSGKVVDVEGSNMTSGGIVDQYPYGGTASQKWTFTDSGDGFYTLKALNSGLFLDVVGAQTTPDTPIDQYSFNGGLNQFWVIQGLNPADSNTVYNLYSPNAAANLNLLEVPGASLDPNVQLGSAPAAGGTCQQWTITAP